jgi:hypothetical protein
VYYYELHEGDDDLFSDLLLAREEEMDPEDFFELVQSIRQRVQGGYEDDTLIEAIAVELERDHGFRALFDSRLTASVHVSTEEDENYLTPLDEDDETAAADYRGILVDLDADDLGPTH